jgi:hypothetical protein
MKIIVIFFGTLFLNSCLHELQKLNCYNHVSLHYLQVLELIEPKICGNLKNKVQVLENRWKVFANIWFCFHAPQYWCGEHSNLMFLVNEVCFHN